MGAVNADTSQAALTAAGWVVGVRPHDLSSAVGAAW